MAKLLETIGYCHRGPYNFYLLNIRYTVEQLQYTAYILKTKTLLVKK